LRKQDGKGRLSVKKGKGATSWGEKKKGLRGGGGEKHNHRAGGQRESLRKRSVSRKKGWGE